MSENKEIRMISDTGYEVFRSERVGGKEYLLAENTKAAPDERYMVVAFEQKAFLGQYTGGVVGGNYDEAAQEFEQRINTVRREIERELDERGFPAELITPEQCVPHSYEQNIKGKVVAIKPDVLQPVYRRGSEQLMYVTGGFGSARNSRGTAVFCVQLSDGKTVRYERHQVLGIVRELPDWAKQRLAAVKAEIAKTKRERNDAR